MLHLTANIQNLKIALQKIGNNISLCINEWIAYISACKSLINAKGVKQNYKWQSHMFVKGRFEVDGCLWYFSMKIFIIPSRMQLQKE